MNLFCINDYLQVLYIDLLFLVLELTFIVKVIKSLRLASATLSVLSNMVRWGEGGETVEPFHTA